jgi:hypothetical protein
VIKDMQRQIIKFTRRLTSVKSLEDREKSDHRSMINFENLYKRHKQRKQFLIRIKMMLKLKVLIILIPLWIGINH